MPLFYFDIHDGVSGLDRIGKDCSDLQAARQEASQQAKTLLARDDGWFRTGQAWQIDVIDSENVAQFNLSFRSSAVVAITIQDASEPLARFRRGPAKRAPFQPAITRTEFAWT